MEKTITELITSKGGVIERNKPKFIEFKLGSHVVIYHKTDQTIELNGEDVSIKTIEQL